MVMILLSFGCKKDSAKTNSDLEKARAVLTAVVDTMERHALNRKSINWTAFREQVLGEVDNYNGYGGNIQKGVERALRLLDDNHSSFTYTNGTDVWGTITLDCTDTTPAMIPMDSTIGYVKVETMSSSNWDEITQYYTAMHQQIAQTDKPYLKGWIVDLRGNHGGNFYPMLRGLAPILGEGTAMFWAYPDNTFDSSVIDSDMMSTAYHLLKPDPKVAVLTDKTLGSSGEAVAICFKGRSNTRSFGNSTCGVSTERKQYNISNVGVLNLTVGIMADRHKNLYGGSVIPDELELSSTLAMQKAISWMKQ